MLQVEQRDQRAMTRAKATSELLSAFHALLRTGDEAQLPDLLLEKNVRLRPYMGALKPALARTGALRRL